MRDLVAICRRSGAIVVSQCSAKVHELTVNLFRLVTFLCRRVVDRGWVVLHNKFEHVTIVQE